MTKQGEAVRARPASRPWTEMLATWHGLAATLVCVVGIDGLVDDDKAEDRHLQTWRTMWALPPCSEARKAAFAIGHAALLIDQWRRNPDGGTDRSGLRWEHFSEDQPGGRLGSPEHPMDAAEKVMAARRRAGEVTLGDKAEAQLRLVAWNIDLARCEARARTIGHEPAIPPHERVYERDADGLVFVAQRGVALGVLWTAEILARAILEDHKVSTFVGGQIIKYRGGTDAFVRAFAETAIASLPDGPWTMTTTDVSRFLGMILLSMLGLAGANQI